MRNMPRITAALATLSCAAMLALSCPAYALELPFIPADDDAGVVETAPVTQDETPSVTGEDVNELPTISATSDVSAPAEVPAQDAQPNDQPQTTSDVTVAGTAPETLTVTHEPASDAQQAQPAESAATEPESTEPNPLIPIIVALAAAALAAAIVVYVRTKKSASYTPKHAA